MSKIRTVKEVTEELTEKRQALAVIFEQAKSDEGLKLNAEQLDDVRNRNTELADLGKELEQAKEMDAIYQANAAYLKEQRQPAKQAPLATQVNDAPPVVVAQRVKSLGEEITDAKMYDEWKQNGRSGDLEINLPDMDAKTLLETTAGFSPETIRTGRIVDSAQRRIVVTDLMPNTTIDQTAVVYMEETTFTNNAAATAEGGAYPESALAWTERSDTVRKVSTFLPVTDEQLEDVPVMRSLLDNRLTFMVRLKEEAQVVTGSGSSPNMTGFLNKSGIQTQALGADTIPDAVYKAITKVRFTGFADPSAVVFHPNDWQSVRLMRTADGVYIWGSPAEAGPERIWGLQVVQTPVMTENTALTGDFPLYSEYFRKRGIVLKVSDSHSDYFVNGKQAVRLDLRGVLAIYRAAAFCTITGI